MRPVCVKCQREYVVKEVGVTLVEVLKNGKPYKLFAADLLACPRCADRIVVASQSASGLDMSGNHQRFEPVVDAAIGGTLYFAREFFTKENSDASKSD